MKSLLIAVICMICGIASAQVNTPPQKPIVPQPFRIQLLEFKTGCELADSSLIEKFEKQILEDYNIDFQFREDDIDNVIYGRLILPPSFQRSILKVIADPKTCEP
jgi:hypothetical protein